MQIDPTISEWLNFIARWVHVFAGIMWVGTTYYFTWLDARLTEEEKAVANTGDRPPRSGWSTAAASMSSKNARCRTSFRGNCTGSNGKPAPPG